MTEEVNTKQFLLAVSTGSNLKVNAELMCSIIDGEKIHSSRIHLTISKFVTDEDGKIVQHKVFGVMQPKMETIDSHIVSIKIEVSDKLEIHSELP